MCTRKRKCVAPAYPMLLAAGTVDFEGTLDGWTEARTDGRTNDLPESDRPKSDRPESRRRRLQWLKPVIVVVLIANGIYFCADRDSDSVS